MTIVRASRGALRPEIYSFRRQKTSAFKDERGFAKKCGELPPALRAEPATARFILKQGRDRTFLIDPLDCLAKQWRH